MTYKVATSEEGVVLFEGVLDLSALHELRERCEVCHRRGVNVRVRLRAGTLIETGVMDELVRLEGVSIAADDRFLAHWIASCLKESRRTPIGPPK